MEIQDFLRWEAASRDSIDVKRMYIDIAEDLVAGILLSQIIFWYLPDRKGTSKITVHRNGKEWVAKKREDWWEECRITPKQFDRASAILEQLGLITIEVFHFHDRPAKHICLNLNVLLERVNYNLTKGEVTSSPKVKLQLDQRGSYYKTEITPETTAEITPKKEEGNPPISPQGEMDEHPLFLEGAEELLPSKLQMVADTQEGYLSPDHTPLERKGRKNPKPQKKDPPPPPSHARAAEAQAVLAHLNTMAERAFEKPGQIPARLKDGATVEDCKLVIDYIAATWSVDFKAKHFDHTTLFRQGNFDKYLGHARAWRPPPAPDATVAPSDREQWAAQLTARFAQRRSAHAR